MKEIGNDTVVDTDINLDSDLQMYMFSYKTADGFWRIRKWVTNGSPS